MRRICSILYFSLAVAVSAQAAHADQSAEQAQAAKMHPKKHPAKPQWVQPAPAHRDLYGAAPAGCTWPYQNQFPPCMSTWPAGDPHYHGSRPGPTFDDD